MNNPIQAPGAYPAASWDPAQPAIKGPPPAPVVNAFRAILVRVALSLISLVILLTSQDRIWAKLHAKRGNHHEATLSYAAWPKFDPANPVLGGWIYPEDAVAEHEYQALVWPAYLVYGLLHHLKL